MVTRWKFFVEAFRRARGGAQKQAEEKHISLLLIGGCVIVLALIVGGVFAALHHATEIAIVLGVLLVAFVAFIWWMGFEAYYAIYCEQCQRAERFLAELEEARERLRPKVSIADQAELEPTQKSCRIRVKSECSVNCSFGAEITGIDPPEPGVPLPFALRLIPETNARKEEIPSGLSRTVDVVVNAVDYLPGTPFDDDRLCFLGIGNSHAVVPRKPYRITVCAYSDREGENPVKDFMVEFPQEQEMVETPPTLRAVPPVQVQSGSGTAGKSQRVRHGWTGRAKAWRRLLRLVNTVLCKHRFTGRPDS